MNNIRKVLLFCSVVSALFLTALQAAVPTQMSYQGKLVDSSGVPLNGDTVITFTIYNAATAGTVLWTEAYTGVSGVPFVSVNQGHFSVSLGSLTPLSSSVFQTSAAYLGVKIGTDAEMTPRVQLLTTPYAFESSTLGGVAKEGFVRTDIDNNLASPLAFVAPGTGTTLIMKITTNNVSNIMQIQKNGKIGIGVTTAYETLEVKGTIKATKFLDQDGNQIKSVDQVWSRPAPDAAIYFLNANVGINNQYPSYQLDVSGNMRIKSKVLIGTGSMSSDLLTVGGNINATSFIGSGANLSGIGATSLATNAAILNLGGDISIGSTVRYLNQRGQWSTVNVTSGLTSGKITYFNGTNLADTMISQVSSKIGIGTTIPNTALEVVGTITATTLNAKVSPLNIVGSNISGSNMKYLNQQGGWTTVNATSGLLTARFPYFNGAALANSTMYQVGNYIGIGITNPSAELHVSGNIKTKTIDILGGADLAEAFDITGEKPEPGTVMIIDAKKPGYLKISKGAYDKKVAGIVSGANGLNPGVVLNRNESLNGTKYPIALAGRVWVKANNEGGKILPGDLLTTSSKSGQAMKVKDKRKAEGAIIGKAMSEARNGIVLVLVNLQ